MKTIVKILFLSGIIGITVFSCEKEKPPPSNQEAPEVFPNKSGYQWTYRLATYNGNIDTVKVKIVSQGILPNGANAKIWKYTYIYPSRTYTDTVWVSSNNNEVRIYDKPCRTCTDKMPFERLRYILPLRTGNSWFTNAPYGDTTKVLDQESISVPAGTFSNAFHLSKVRGYVTNSWTNDTIYFKKHVGLVKFSQNEFNLEPLIGNGVWELISYSFGQ